jgi:hypothetical protein
MPEDMETRLALAMGTASDDDVLSIGSESSSSDTTTLGSRHLFSRSLSGKPRRSSSRRRSSVAARQRRRSR